MIRFRRIGAYVLLVIAIVIGFLLPTIVARIQDAQADQTRQVVNSTRVQLDMGSSLTTLQKLRIVAERASSVELDSAPTMDEDQAREELLAGVGEMFSEELAGVQFPVDGFSEVSHRIILKMSGEDSLIYWEFWMVDGDGNQINATVDDETGLILSLQYTLNLTPADEGREEVDLQPHTPLFMIRENVEDTGGVLSENGIFGEIEEAESSMESFLRSLEMRYCFNYMWSKDNRFEWDMDIPEPEGNSYLCSVMMVDNAGGYYMLPISVSNNEIIIN